MPRPPAAEATRAGRVLRSPLLHFALIGGLLFLADRVLREPPPSALVRISAREITEIESDWRGQTGRSPNDRELRLLIDGRVDDKLLIEQAFALGWHRSDAIVQRRLMQNQRFLAPGDEAGPAQLLERAYEQGMDRSDIVVRRRLLERMKLAIASAARDPEPTDAELSDYLELHPERFRRDARVRLLQIFLSRDLRGEQLERDAERLAERLARDHVSPDRATDLGDPFLLSSELPLWSGATLARRFGPQFAPLALQAAPERWNGPIPSSYGLHFVWLLERAPQRLPPLAIVRPEVRAALLREREQRALHEHLKALRSEARIEVGDP